MVQTQSSSSVEIDPLWREFLQTRVNSFIKWDLVRFFHDNPHTADTAENIAQFVGRDAKTVRRELDGLVSAEVLTTKDVARVHVYQLTEEDELRRLIDDFVTLCHDREFRVKAIYHVIHGMGFTPRHDF